MKLFNYKNDHICFGEINKNDLDRFHDYVSDADVSRYIGWPLTKSKEETEDYFDSLVEKMSAGTHEYAFVYYNEEHVGTVMLFNFDKEAKNAEVGYVFHKDSWHKGICSKALELVKAYAFNELQLHKLCARVASDNIGSSKALLKVGFKEEGRLVDQFLIDGVYNDCLLYGYLK